MDELTQKSNQSPVVPAPAKAQSEPIAFELLPLAIRTHLNSKTSFETMYGLETEFNIPPEKMRVIPFILGAVVTGEMEAKSVVAALKLGLQVDDAAATKIASTIKDKILNPIAGGLLLTAGVDVEPMPGSSAKDATDLPELVEELNPFLAQELGREKSEPEPLSTAPSYDTTPLRTTNSSPKPGVGMAEPGLRTIMSDLKKPQGEARSSVARGSVEGEIKSPTEPLRATGYPPTGRAGELRTAPKPFMLHEEKPASPGAIRPVTQSESFVYTPSNLPTQPKTASRPATAQFGSSFEGMLESKKPETPAPARTQPETPKVVHYTSFKTTLDEQGNPKNQS